MSKRSGSVPAPLVAVRGPEQEQSLAAGRERGAVQLDVAGQQPGERLGRRVEAQRLLDGRRDERGSASSWARWSGNAASQKIALPSSFVVVSLPAISSRKQKPSTSAGESDRSPSSAATQRADEIVARAAPPVGDHVVEVAVEPGRALDPRRA